MNLFKTIIERSTKHEAVEEFRFHPVRRWRFDFAIPELKIAVEIEGGSWVQGRHTRGAGYQGDMEKYNQAVILGWKVLRYTPTQADKCMDDLAKIMEGLNEERNPPDFCSREGRRVKAGK